MGLHIIAYKLKGKLHDEYAGYYWDTEGYEGFDSLRYGGDKEFASQEFFIETTDKDIRSGFDDQQYYRITDHEKASEWVRANLPDGNQRRLLKLIEDMQNDHTLHITFSY